MLNYFEGILKAHGNLNPVSLKRFVDFLVIHKYVICSPWTHTKKKTFQLLFGS